MRVARWKSLAEHPVKRGRRSVHLSNSPPTVKTPAEGIYRPNNVAGQLVQSRRPGKSGLIPGADMISRQARSISRELEHTGRIAADHDATTGRQSPRRLRIEFLDCTRTRCPSSRLRPPASDHKDLMCADSRRNQVSRRRDAQAALAPDRSQPRASRSWIPSVHAQVAWSSDAGSQFVD